MLYCKLFLFSSCRHNDLPWNIRKFLHNQLHDFHFSEDLRQQEPWSQSVWSHTDLHRLKQGMVGAQVKWKKYPTCHVKCHFQLAVMLIWLCIDSSGRPMFHVDHSTSTQCSWLWSRLMWFTVLWINILIICNLLQAHKVRLEFTAKLPFKIETRWLLKKWPLRLAYLVSSWIVEEMWYWEQMFLEILEEKFCQLFAPIRLD